MEDPFQNQSLQPQPAEVKTSWFKRLKLWLILAGVFAVLGITGLIFFYRQNITADHLIDLAPVDSVLYAHARDSVWFWQKEGIADLPFTDLFNQLDDDFGLSEEVLKNQILGSADEAALLLLPDQDNLKSALLFKLKRSYGLPCARCKGSADMAKTILLDRPNSLEIRKGIIVLATSQEVLEKIKEVDQNSIFSLASQVDLKKMNQGSMNLYLDSDNLKTYLNQKPGSSEEIFGQLTIKDSYLTMNKKSDQWRFSLISKFFNQPNPNKQLAVYLPKDFSIFFSNINLIELFSERGEIFSEPFWQNIDSLGVVYNFDFRASADIFLNQQVDLIIFNNNNDSALGFDYIMFVPQTAEEDINRLENLVKVILAQKLPRPLLYMLPDGSQVTELLADINSWQWQKESINDNNSEISYLKEPALNFGISYSVQGDKTIIASSPELLKTFILAGGFSLNDLVNQCDRNILGSRYAIFNSNNIFSRLDIYLPDGVTLIRETENALKGCIIDF